MTGREGIKTLERVPDPFDFSSLARAALACKVALTSNGNKAMLSKKEFRLFILLSVVVFSVVAFLILNKEVKPIDATDPDVIVVAIIDRKHTDDEIKKAIVQFGNPSGYGKSANLSFLSACASHESGHRRQLALWLLSQGANVNPEQGQPPLLFAIANGDAHLAISLLKAGAKWEQPTASGIPLIDDAVVKSSPVLARIRQQEPQLAPH